MQLEVWIFGTLRRRIRCQALAAGLLQNRSLSWLSISLERRQWRQAVGTLAHAGSEHLILHALVQCQNVSTLENVLRDQLPAWDWAARHWKRQRRSKRSGVTTSLSAGGSAIAQTMLNITYQKLIQNQYFVEVMQICRVSSVSYLYCEERRSVETTPLLFGQTP